MVFEADELANNPREIFEDPERLLQEQQNIEGGQDSGVPNVA